jgi:hypothetical protein
MLPRPTRGKVGEEGYMRLFVLLVTTTLLCGCQSSQHSSEELATICRNPVNRQPGVYFDECQKLYPLSAKQLRRIYQQNPPN